MSPFEFVHLSLACNTSEFAMKVSEPINTTQKRHAISRTMANALERGSRYILRAFSPNNWSNKRVSSNTFKLSSIGVNWNDALIASSIAIGTTESGKDSNVNRLNTYVSRDFYDTTFAKAADITRLNNDSVAFFDKDYINRRRYLRDFSSNGEINSVIETIADEAIVYDEKNYFIGTDFNNLKSKMKKTKEAGVILEELQASFDRVYQMYGWTDSNDAWSYMKKFLVDGFLAFEIIYDYGETLNDPVPQAKDIIAFKEIDPCTLQPDIVKDEVTGEDLKVWYQFKDDAEKERIIPDSHIVYISWLKGNFEGRTSYLENLTRTFNMLRQLENSRIIWNIQNAQKRIKIVVPIGTSTPDRAQARLDELKAYYNEDTQIDDMSGEVTVNGQPKFSFSSTYIFPSKDGAQTEIDEIGVEGYDMNSVEQLKYWWRRFILETKIPANRFMLDPTSGGTQTPISGEGSITREEYAFARFIKRIQIVFKELLLKPMWLQFCLKYPAFAKAENLKSLIGLKFNYENIFEMEKERNLVNAGAQTVMSMAQMKRADGQPYFAMEFLVKKFLGLSDADLKENENYKLREAKEAIDMQVEAKEAAGAAQAPGAAPGMDSGLGGMDMGMGAPGGDMGAGGMDMGMTPDAGAPMDMGAAPDAGGMDMGSSAPMM